LARCIPFSSENTESGARRRISSHVAAELRQNENKRKISLTKGAKSRSICFIIGGGINGCGIARDAAGRGLSVTLAEMNDLASATSSASTKLFHGGLRYLEYFEVRWSARR
jgi:glycerol-3-phosphate dehydrogenase